MKTIAVIFGGVSAEHDVSIITAISSVIKPLQATSNYKVIPVYISKKGTWYSTDELAEIATYTTGKIETVLSKSRPVSIDINNGFTIIKQKSIGKNERIVIDVVFPAMHGTYGEDGALMGLLDMARIPYVGCGRTAASIAMNKSLAKRVVASYGVSVVQSVELSNYEIGKDLNSAIEKVAQTKLGYPVFVKPVHLGSSIGITKAANRDELANGLEVAAYYDDTIIVEKAVQNLIEVTLPIIGNKNNTIPALLEQPLTQGQDYFDFDTKYLQGGKKGKNEKQANTQGYSTIPAQLPEKIYKQAEAVGIAAYEALGCEGIARIDMLIDEKAGEIYFNEANPLPGGLYVHNWRANGMSAVELVEKLIEFALERNQRDTDLQTTFTTNYLQQFGG
jgi:D-alanine-D-alanine ligase